jgi:molybdopterin converting factor small subunit/uncharacterized damage-inducible protein DinB
VSQPAVELLLPGSLADLAGGSRSLTVHAPGGTLADLLDALADAHPPLERRIRDETGAVRRYVNVYVDGADIRAGEGLATALRDGSTVQVLPSIAGGSAGGSGSEQPTAYSPQFPGVEREPMPGQGDERTMLTALLDWHRATLAAKCAGLTGEQLRERAIPPSTMSLHGLVRHLAGVERWWFGEQFAKRGLAPLYTYEDDEDEDFNDLSRDFADDLAVWAAECDAARAIVARSSLDDTGTRRSTGEPVSLRWILLHLIAEYARHNGHADLLRERLDGATGY